MLLASRAAVAIVVSLPSPGPPASALDSDFGGFGEIASLVSRDSLLYVYVDDRAACVRRAGDTILGRALHEYDDEDLNAVLIELASEASIFLPPGALETFGFALARGHGAAALSVEGMVSQGDTLVPEVLAIADLDGLSGFCAHLREIRKGGDARDDALDELEDLDLPFEVDATQPIVETAGPEAAILEFSVGGKTRVAVAEHGGLLIAASRRDTIQRALERARNPSFGSLRDSLRFRELWRALEPGRGALAAYVNLRRIRQDGGLAAEWSDWAGHLVNDRLAAFDGIALSIRGRGERFLTRFELERGRSSGDEPLLRKNVALDYAKSLPASPLVASLQLDGAAMVTAIAGASRLSGSEISKEQVARFVDDCGGTRVFEPLASVVGPGVDCFLIGDADSGVSPPELAFRVAVRDAAVVEHVLQDLAKRVPGRVRAGRIGTDTTYAFQLGSLFAASPSLALRDDHLLVAMKPARLRDLLRSFAEQPRLACDSRWLAAFDRLDVDPAAPSVAQAFVDSGALAEAAQTWLTVLFPPQRSTRDEARRIGEVFHALGDPDLQEALGPIAVRAESRPSGVRIEISGL